MFGIPSPRPAPVSSTTLDLRQGLGGVWYLSEGRRTWGKFPKLESALAEACWRLEGRPGNHQIRQFDGMGVLVREIAVEGEREENG